MNKSCDFTGVLKLDDLVVFCRSSYKRRRRGDRWAPSCTRGCTCGPTSRGSCRTRQTSWTTERRSPPDFSPKFVRNCCYHKLFYDIIWLKMFLHTRSFYIFTAQIKTHHLLWQICKMYFITWIHNLVSLVSVCMNSPYHLSSPSVCRKTYWSSRRCRTRTCSIRFSSVSFLQTKIRPDQADPCPEASRLKDLEGKPERKTDFIVLLEAYWLVNFPRKPSSLRNNDCLLPIQFACWRKITILLIMSLCIAFIDSK